MTPVPRLRAYAGPALLTYGFRPFFLFGAIYAGLTILAWLPMFYGELEFASVFAPVDWHVHEMLYGYLPAIITGFLLTAIPNWTGRLPIRACRCWCWWWRGWRAASASRCPRRSAGWRPGLSMPAS